MLARSTAATVSATLSAAARGDTVRWSAYGRTRRKRARASWPRTSSRAHAPRSRPKTAPSAPRHAASTMSWRTSRKRRRAERGADAELARASRRAREHEARHAGRRGEQDEQRRAEQHEQGRTDAGHHVVAERHGPQRGRRVPGVAAAVPRARRRAQILGRATAAERPDAATAMHVRGNADSGRLSCAGDGRSGSHNSGSARGGKTNVRGRTPTTVCGSPLSMIGRGRSRPDPAPNRRGHAPSDRAPRPARRGTASAGAKPRPSAGVDAEDVEERRRDLNRGQPLGGADTGRACGCRRNSRRSPKTRASRSDRSTKSDHDTSAPPRTASISWMTSTRSPLA